MMKNYLMGQFPENWVYGFKKIVRYEEITMRRNALGI